MKEKLSGEWKAMCLTTKYDYVNHTVKLGSSAVPVRISIQNDETRLDSCPNFTNVFKNRKQCADQCLFLRLGEPYGGIVVGENGQSYTSLEDLKDRLALKKIEQ